MLRYAVYHDNLFLMVASGTQINPSLRHDGLTFGEYSEVTIQNYLVYGVQPNANAIQINDNNDGGST